MRIGAGTRPARAALTVYLKISILSSTCACSTHLVRVLLICTPFFMTRLDAPLILLSHIPLYRSPNASCGPLREKGSIPAVRGNGYQTQLSPETSRLLLEEFRPSLIFRYSISYDYLLCG